MDQVVDPPPPSNRDEVERVRRALEKAIQNNANTRDPIMEQLKTCPEAFKVGEILGRAFDSLKHAQDEEPHRERYFPPARRHSTPRVIGLPLEVTFPRLKGVRWRYCTRWDEGLRQSWNELVRLGICQPNDWSGSAVDLVERGFKSFLHPDRAVDAKRVWVGDLRITDSLFELTEQERNQVDAGEKV